MAYGAYMPKDQDVTSSSFTVASLVTLIAIIACLAILTIIFAINWNTIERNQLRKVPLKFTDAVVAAAAAAGNASLASYAAVPAPDSASAPACDAAPVFTTNRKFISPFGGPQTVLYVRLHPCAKLTSLINRDSDEVQKNLKWNENVIKMKLTSTSGY